jgi:hypothetical protein
MLKLIEFGSWDWIVPIRKYIEWIEY